VKQGRNAPRKHLSNFVYTNSQRKSRLFAAAAAISSKQAAKQITKKFPP